MSKAERKAFAASGKATLRLNASAPGQLDLKGTAKFGRKRGQAFVASLYVEKPGDLTVPVSLSKKARKQLRRSGSLTIELDDRIRRRQTEDLEPGAEEMTDPSSSAREA